MDEDVIPSMLIHGKPKPLKHFIYRKYTVEGNTSRCSSNPYAMVEILPNAEPVYAFENVLVKKPFVPAYNEDKDEVSQDQRGVQGARQLVVFAAYLYYKTV